MRGEIETRGGLFYDALYVGYRAELLGKSEITAVELSVHSCLAAFVRTVGCSVLIEVECEFPCTLGADIQPWCGRVGDDFADFVPGHYAPFGGVLYDDFLVQIVKVLEELGEDGICHIKYSPDAKIIILETDEMRVSENFLCINIICVNTEVWRVNSAPI